MFVLMLSAGKPFGGSRAGGWRDLVWLEYFLFPFIFFQIDDSASLIKKWIGRRLETDPPWRLRNCSVEKRSQARTNVMAIRMEGAASREDPLGKHHTRSPQRAASST